jgi:hypothetical protein
VQNGSRYFVVYPISWNSNSTICEPRKGDLILSVCMENKLQDRFEVFYTVSNHFFKYVCKCRAYFVEE